MEASWDGEGVVVGLGWALDPMQEATAVSVPILLVLQEDVHWKFSLEPIPTVEFMTDQHRVMVEDLVPAKATIPADLTMQGLTWASMLGGPLQGRL